MTWSMDGLGQLVRVGNVSLAMLLALVSTGCYATSAVLQEREASGPSVQGPALVRQLIRRPWWWLAVLAAVTAAGLHIALSKFEQTYARTSPLAASEDP